MEREAAQVNAQGPYDDRFQHAHELYRDARERMVEGSFEAALRLLKASAVLTPHFKTLELLGECLMALDRWTEAVAPLAAATTLNRGVRAPSLLAEVFLKLEDWHAAQEMAEVALSRDPHNRKALMVKERVAAHLAA